MLDSSVLGPDAVRLSKENNTSNGHHSIVYIGGAKKNLFEEMMDLGYDTLSFNLSYAADLWLKSNTIANSRLPDAIVCDLELPDTDAFTLYESLKVNDNLNTVPFIIIAQHSNSLDKIKAFELGIDDFYSNNVLADDLHNRILLLNSLKKEKAKSTTAKDIPLTVPYKINWPKRIFDLLFSLTLIIILSPLIIIVAILIKLESKGPVLYISKRVGTGYKIFDFYKFRTMQKDADLKLPSIMHLNEYVPERERAIFFKVENDPRVTRLGRKLRKIYLDELPQLFNVIKGDMSMVGNRPLPLYEAENLTTDLWVKRFLAPAGITGLWQISKYNRKHLSERERKELDVAYADKSSLWFDTKIIIKTLLEIFSK